MRAFLDSHNLFNYFKNTLEQSQKRYFIQWKSFFFNLNGLVMLRLEGNNFD